MKPAHLRIQSSPCWGPPAEAAQSAGQAARQASTGTAHGATSSDASTPTAAWTGSVRASADSAPGECACSTLCVLLMQPEEAGPWPSRGGSQPPQHHCASPGNLHSSTGVILTLASSPGTLCTLMVSWFGSALAGWRHPLIGVQASSRPCASVSTRCCACTKVFACAGGTWERLLAMPTLRSV